MYLPTGRKPAHDGGPADMTGAQVGFGGGAQFGIVGGWGLIKIFVFPTLTANAGCHVVWPTMGLGVKIK